MYLAKTIFAGLLFVVAGVLMNLSIWYEFNRVVEICSAYAALAALLAFVCNFLIYKKKKGEIK